MDPLTHALSGSLLKQAGEHGRHGSSMTLFCVASAMLPDIDVVGRVLGQEFYLLHHRGLTHSVVLAPILCWVFSLLFYRFSSIKDLKLLFRLSLLGVGTHLLLDLITSYGTTLFYPFSRRRYAADFVFIIDIALTAILLVAVRLCRRRPENGIRTARIGFLILALYVAACGACHSIAGNRLKDWAKTSLPDILRVSALPKPPMLFCWGGVVETPDRYYHAYFNLLSPERPEWTAFPKTLNSPFFREAEKTEIVKSYRHFARFPAVFYRKKENHHIMEYCDLRFQIGPGFTNMPFLLKLVYDDRGELLDSGLRSGKPLFREPASNGEESGHRLQAGD